MASQEHYSLRWNDHQNQILLAFEALLQAKSLVDVTLVCAETSIRAHKVVLSACSPFFQRVFAENPCKHPVIVLKDFNGWVVQAIVDFMYRGEISVPQERLQTLIQAGESLQVRGLIDHPVTGNTPTPAASPDDFSGLIAKRDGSSFKGETKFEAEPLHYYQPIMYGGGPYKDKMYEALLSPLPRRKQARPRRRSGDFSPPGKMGSNGDEANNEEDCENNKNFKNIDAERADKGSLSKSSSIQSLDSAVDEPEDLCTKPSEMGDDMDLSVSAKQQQQKSSSVRQPEEEEDSVSAKKCNVSSASANGSSSNLKQQSLSAKEKLDSENNNNRIVLSLKDIRHFNNHVTSDNQQRAHQLMTSRFLNQSPSTILKTMSSHLGFNASGGGGRLSPKSLAEAKFHAMQFRGVPPMNLTGSSRHGKFFGLNDDEAEDQEDEEEEDEDEEAATERQEKSMADEAMDAESVDENNHHHHQQQNKQGSDDGRKSKDSKSDRRRSRSHHSDLMGDNNNNSRLDMLMSMNGPNPLLMDHMEFQKHRQQFFHHQQQQHQQQQHQQQQQHKNGLDGLKSLHNRTSSSSQHDLLGESRKSHNESTPGGGGGGGGGGRQKDFSMSLPPPFNMHHQPGDAHPPFPPMPSVSSLALTPPHMFGLDTPLGLFPPHHGMDPSKLYSPLMEMSDPRGMHPDQQQPYLKKKGKFLGRPKGQHSAPRGGPPRSWTNAELTEALQHVWNKKMTTSQASRIFGIPYNSLLMYVRGKYGKSLKLEQLRKDCISGPPIELLQMGVNKGGSNNPNGSNASNHSGSTAKDNGSHHNSSGGSGSSKELKEFDLGGNGPDLHNDLMSSSNPMFNPFPANFYPDFAAGFPLSMLNLLPPDGRQAASLAAAAAAAGHLPSMSMDDDEDCKSEERSKQSLEDEDHPGPVTSNGGGQPMDLNSHHRPEIMQHQEIM